MWRGGSPPSRLDRFRDARSVQLRRVSALRSAKGDSIDCATNDGPLVVPTYCAFSAAALGGQLLATADSIGGLRLTDTGAAGACGLEPRSYTKHFDDLINNCTWLEGDRHVALCGSAGVVKLADTERCESVAALDGHVGSVLSVAQLQLNPGTEHCDVRC